MRHIALILPAASLLALSACGREEEPMANRFERQAAEIRNKAEALEAEVENRVSAAEARLDNQIDTLLNSRETAEEGDNAPEANASR